MSKHLPTHGFRWLTEAEIRDLIISAIDEEGEDGYILEVDLRYPAHLHQKHNDYPLAAEHLEITSDMLSEYQKDKYPKHKLRPTSKLTPNLLDKTRYIVHSSNLKYYLEQGMELTKVHRVLTFKQSPWLREYVEFNSTQRGLATSEFAKNFFKLMNNSVFGELHVLLQALPDMSTPL